MDLHLEMLENRLILGKIIWDFPIRYLRQDHRMMGSGTGEITEVNTDNKDLRMI